MITVIKLLFFSFRLILATTHPKVQDRVRTKIEIRSISSRQPKIAPADADTAIQYTMTAGRITTMEYIAPMRYTVSRREAINTLTGMGRDSIRSLSLDRYRQE